MIIRMTIVESVLKALEIINGPADLKKIYTTIIENDLYSFNAQSPLNALSVQVRRHCEGLDFPTAKATKHFQILSNGKYWLANTPIPGQSKEELEFTNKRRKDSENLKSTVLELKNNHEKHLNAFKQQILNQLKEMSPEAFEIFSKRLLEVYGFKKMKVTSYVKDGGIDGHGELKVGITHLNVAFQSKRWKNNPIGRVEIDRFRGATQGEYEQGIIFTTSKFTKDALAATRKAGAIPIILIDGESMIDIMIEKKFGIEIENMPVYINALDNVLND